LAILPPHGNQETYGKHFAELCGTVGLSIKDSNSEEGTTVSFGGVEIDTAKMVIQLPTKKLSKARAIVQAAANQNSLSLLELQALTGYLNFASIVTPLGRTFLHRLYNMQIYFPTRGPKCRRHLLTDARKDLRWWKKLLEAAPERSIQQEHSDTVYLWSDAVGTKGLSAYYYETRNSSHHGPCSTRTEQTHSSP